MATPALADVIHSHIEQAKTGIFTAIPATITSTSDYTEKATIDVIPSIERSFTDGKSYPYPTLYDVPVMFPSGGGALLSFPLKVGDDVLLVFSMRSIDELMLSESGNATPEDRRTHNISDAFAIPCLFREANVIPPDADNVVLKFDEATITITPDGEVSLENANGSDTLLATGNKEITVPSSISITNTTGELISLVNQLALQVAAITVPTVAFPYPAGAPINNLVAVLAIQTQIASFIAT